MILQTQLSLEHLFPLLLLRKQPLSCGQKKHSSRSKIVSSRDPLRVEIIRRRWRWRLLDGQQRFVGKVFGKIETTARPDGRIVIYAIHFPGRIVRVHIAERTRGTFLGFHVEDLRSSSGFFFFVFLRFSPFFSIFLERTLLPSVFINAVII